MYRNRHKDIYKLVNRAIGRRRHPDTRWQKQKETELMTRDNGPYRCTAFQLDEAKWRYLSSKANITLFVIIETSINGAIRVSK